MTASLLQACSADMQLLRSLRERPVRGLVHSVFDRVVNIEGDEGEWFSIASRDLDNAPDTVVVDASGFAASGIVGGDRVVATGAEVLIDGRIRFRLDDAGGWSAALPHYPAGDAMLRQNVAAARARIGRHAVGGGTSPREARSVVAHEMATVLQRHADMLCAALRRADLESACEHAKAMIGLGPGLTPSGDDFLVGLLAVLNVPGSPCRNLTSFGAGVLAQAQERTNAISVAALRAAAGGRVRASIHALLRELLGGSPESVSAALEPVLEIGSTSGTDIAAGVVSGIEVNLQVSREAWK